jgi:hypothetical protein
MLDHRQLARAQLDGANSRGQARQLKTLLQALAPQYVFITVTYKDLQALSTTGAKEEQVPAGAG